MTKILFTTPDIEHPPAGGPTLRIENSIKALARIAELHIVARVSEQHMGGAQAAAFFRQHCAKLVYSPSALYQLPDGGFREDAQAIVGYADTHGIKIIWFGYGNISYNLMKLIKTARPDIRIVCDTDSVWSRFLLRQLPFEPSAQARALIEKDGHAKEREEADFVNFCDATTAVSEVDAVYYRGLATDPSKIHVFSNVIDLDNYLPQPPPAGFKKPCLYLAGRFYAPDSPMANAARWVISEVLPIVNRSIPDAHLYIIGFGSSECLADIRAANVTVVGQVETVLPYLSNASVSLVPLMFESGTRFKIMEAGACRVPMVSTTLGAEGIPVKDGEHMLIADTPEAFAAAAVRIIQDGALGKRLADNCRLLIEKSYSLAEARREAQEILRYLGV